MRINIGTCNEIHLSHKFLYVYDASENVDIVKEWLKKHFDLDFKYEVRDISETEVQCMFYTNKDILKGWHVVYENLIDIRSKDVYIVYEESEFKVYPSEEFHKKYTIQIRRDL